MIKDRSLTVHTYNRDTAEAIVTHITEQFFELFHVLESKM